MSTNEAHNKEVIRILFEEVWNEKNFDNFNKKVASPVTMHFRGASFPTNIDDLRKLVDYWHQAFSDLHYEIGHLIAEDDMVAVRLTVSGKHTGTWEGMSATGHAIKFSEMMFFRFENGIIVEMWEDYDELSLRQKLQPAEVQ